MLAHDFDALVEGALTWRFWSQTKPKPANFIPAD
jgi:hypothetical protein